MRLLIPETGERLSSPLTPFTAPDAGLRKLLPIVGMCKFACKSIGIIVLIYALLSTLDTSISQ